MVPAVPQHVVLVGAVITTIVMEAVLAVAVAVATILIRLPSRVLIRRSVSSTWSAVEVTTVNSRNA